MITVNGMMGREGGTTEFELKGLSTDEKPTDEVNGRKIGVNSVFLELDTGDLYYFTGAAWAKVGG